MPNTITSYHTFAANTKARAAQMNTNLSNHRGTLVPINSDTASASDDTHDLGSTEHRWQYVYVRAVDLRGLTSTVNHTIIGDTTAAGGFRFKIGSTEVMRIMSDGTGLGTTTAAFYQLALGATIASAYPETTTAMHIAGSTITITTLGGIVEIGLNACGLVANTTTSGNLSYIQVSAQGTNNPHAVISLIRNGSTISATNLGGNSVGSLQVPVGSIRFTDIVSAGTYTYNLCVQSNNATAGGAAGIFFQNVRTFAYCPRL